MKSDAWARLRDRVRQTATPHAMAKRHPSPSVRGLQHNLAVRTEAAIAAGLFLRKRTALHLRGLSEKREYLVVRYDPDLSAMSEINRLSATLEEVAAKVMLLLQPDRETVRSKCAAETEI